MVSLRLGPGTALVGSGDWAYERRAYGRNHQKFICGSESEVEPPVLEHGPRSLILVQVDGFKSRRRNESDVSQA